MTPHLVGKSWKTYLFLFLFPCCFGEHRQLRINISGYQQCVFNLVDPNFERILSWIDLTEMFLIQNQGNQAWTLQSSGWRMEDNNAQNISLDFRLLKESCSVNILIVNEYSRNYSVHTMLGPRFFSIRNTILVLHKGSVESLEGLSFGLASSAQIDTAFLALSQQFLSFETVRVYCHSCPPPNNSRFTKNINVSVQEIKTISSNLKHFTLYLAIQIVTWCGAGFGSTDETKSCTFRNLQRLRVIGSENGIPRCDPRCRSIENLSMKFNMSFWDVNDEETLNNLGSFYSVPNYFRVTAVWVTSYTFAASDVSPKDHLLVQLLMGKAVKKFIYCVTEPEREAFSSAFWTIPFDKWSWIGLGISGFVLSVLLGGKWVEVVAILMRQSTSILTGNKMLVLLMLVTVVITCGYESIISCYLTVLPPILMLDSLKDLLKIGYRLLLYSPISNNEELAELIDRENITSLDELLYQGDLPWTPDKLFQLLETGKVLVVWSGCGKATLQLPFSTNYDPKIKCFCTSELSISSPKVFQFSGHDRRIFGQALQSLIESGVYQMYEEIHRFIMWFGRDRELQEFEDASNEPTAFQITEAKMFSIFIGWISLSVLAILTFVAERMHLIPSSIPTMATLMEVWKSWKPRIYSVKYLGVQFLRYVAKIAYKLLLRMLRIFTNVLRIIYNFCAVNIAERCKLRKNKRSL